MNKEYLIETLLSDVAKHLPDDTPYEAIKKICIYCINYSMLICEMNLTTDEKKILIDKIIKEY